MLGALIAAAIIPRCWTIGGRSLWCNEAFSWRLTTYDLPELLSRAARDNNPPLYWVLLKGWAAVWGESTFALRSLSVLAGAATMLGIYLFAREAFPRERYGGRSTAIGLFSAALIGASAFHVHWAQAARMYTLGTALSVFSSWAMFRAQRLGSLRSWILYAALAVLFAYTHTYAPFSLAAQGVFLAGWLVVRCKGRLGTPWREGAIRGPALAAVIVAAAYGPWVGVLLEQRAQVQQDYWTKQVSLHEIEHTCYGMWLDPLHPDPGTPVQRRLAAIFSLALVAALLWKPRTAWEGRPTSDAARPGEIYVLIAATLPWILAIVISLVDTKIFHLRFLLFAHTYLVMALAILICRIPMRLERNLAGVAVTTVLLWAAVLHVRDMDGADRPGVRGAAKLINANRDPGEPVIVCSPTAFYPMLYHAGERSAVWLYDQPDAHIHYFGAAVLPVERLIDDDALKRLATRRAWVVNSHGAGLDRQVVAVPARWRAVSETRFAEVDAMPRGIAVIEYAIGPKADPPRGE